MRLYKYRSVDKNALNLLVSNRIYFSNVTDFNDPFEGKVYPNMCVTGDAAREQKSSVIEALSRVDWASSVASIHRILTSSNRYASLFFKDRATVEGFVKMRERHRNLSDSQFVEAVQSENERVDLNYAATRGIRAAVDTAWRDSSVFCLSERFDHMLLYSHYADRHRGFCIEFDPSKDPGISDAKAVAYSNTYPEVSIEFVDAIELPRLTPAQQHALFFTKSRAWEYEKEWRVFRNQPAGTQEINPDAITGIIFGCRISTADEALIRRVLAGRRILFRRAVMQERTFELSLTHAE
jgi:hypothetical protein